MSSRDCVTNSRSERVEKLKRKWERCYKCHFAQVREHLVMFRGHVDSGVVLVGEAPGKTEDHLGVPFAGTAGRILDSGMKLGGLSEKNSCIVNALACRPCDSRFAHNRTPSMRELLNCRPRFQALLNILAPRVLILLGNTGTEAVFGYSAIPKRVEVHGCFVYRCLHPAALLYRRELQRDWTKFWTWIRKERANWKTAKRWAEWDLPA